MKGYINWVGGALLFALIIIGISNYNKYKHNYEEQSSLITSFQDSIKYYKDKDGKNSAQIALLEGSKENLLKIIGKSDAQLTKLLKKGASSGTVFNQTTKFDTIVTVKRDTINGVIEFSNSIKNNWIDLQVKVKDDSLQTFLETRDSLSVSFQKVKQGFLKPKKSVVVVTNANPYVKTTGLRSFDIPQNKSNLKFWFGVGIGAGAGYLLFR
jgi:hypothetical protein